jgi:hypothetical protein
MTFQPPRPPSLRTKEEILTYLAAALDDGDPKRMVAVLADIAKGRVRQRPWRREHQRRHQGLSRLTPVLSSGEKP